MSDRGWDDLSEFNIRMWIEKLDYSNAMMSRRLLLHSNCCCWWWWCQYKIFSEKSFYALTQIFVVQIYELQWPSWGTSNVYNFPLTLYLKLKTPPDRASVLLMQFVAWRRHHDDNDDAIASKSRYWKSLIIKIFTIFIEFEVLWKLCHSCWRFSSRIIDLRNAGEHLITFFSPSKLWRL